MKLGEFHGYYCPFRDSCRSELGGDEPQCASCTKLPEKLKLAFSSILKKEKDTMEKKIYLGNAFSLQMLNEFPADVKISSVTEEEVHNADSISVVGHLDTAVVLQVPYNRVSVKLHKGDILYVAQLMGGRLPEGCTTLPDGYSFKFLKVEVL